MKPKILLIPNVSGWIIGEMAKKIVLHYGCDYDFYYLSNLVLRRKPSLIQRILPCVDFVHAMDESCLPSILNVTKMMSSPPPLVTWVHHIADWSVEHQMAFQYSDMLIATTDEWKQTFLSYGYNNKIEVVRYGIDTQFFRSLHPNRTRFGMPENSFIVGFVGSQSSDSQGRKGLDTLLEVIKKLSTEIPNLHISFSGLLWEKTVRTLKKSGISANTVGFLPKSLLPYFYSSLNLCLSTSRIEGGPYTVLEAMACATPVASTRTGLVPSVIQDGINGFSVDPGDVENLVLAIKRVASSSELAKLLGRNARQTVEDNFTWQQTLRTLEKPYADMVNIAQSRSKQTYTPNVFVEPNKLMKAVCVADSLLWTIALVRRGNITPKIGIRMLLALWEEYNHGDIICGLALLAGRI